MDFKMARNAFLEFAHQRVTSERNTRRTAASRIWTSCCVGVTPLHGTSGDTLGLSLRVRDRRRSQKPPGSLRHPLISSACTPTIPHKGVHTARQKMKPWQRCLLVNSCGLTRSRAHPHAPYLLILRPAQSSNRARGVHFWEQRKQVWQTLEGYSLCQVER